MITMHAHPRETDRQTDGRTHIMAIARRFVNEVYHALKTIELNLTELNSVMRITRTFRDM